jgi:hypothetical protein
MDSSPKIILDACCGGRMFWFNKKHPHVLYIDKRVRPKGFMKSRPSFSVEPDEVGDFTKLRSANRSFKMVVFDPPHCVRQPAKKEGIIAARYGELTPNNWRDQITKGFSECWRVLEDYGVLIFKWNEESVKIGVVLKLLPIEPLFGQKAGTRHRTHWLCFMKIPD